MSPDPGSNQTLQAVPDILKGLAKLRLEIYASVLIAAWQSNHGGAYRLFILAKALDPRGGGAVKQRDLKAACDRLKVNEREFWRWLADAKALGLFYRWDSLPDSLRLTSHAQAAATLFHLAAKAWESDKRTAGTPCPAIYGNVEKHRPKILLKKLFQKGWRAVVYQAYYKAKTEKKYKDKKTQKIKVVTEKISQATMQKITGICPADQRLFQKGMRIRPNYALTGLKADQLTGLREHKIISAPQVFKHYKTGESEISRRLPDTRRASAGISLGTIGRSRKIQSFLNISNRNSLCLVPQAAKFDSSRMLRIIYDKPHQERATRVLQVIHKRPDDPNEIFVFLRHSKHTPTDLYTQHTVGYGIPAL